MSTVTSIDPAVFSARVSEIGVDRPGLVLSIAMVAVAD
jgi:hypothetical protein